MKKVRQQTRMGTVVAPSKTYVPAPHPQQHRIDAIRVVPSLVTCNPELAPKGK